MQFPSTRRVARRIQGKHRPVSLISVRGKVVEQVILSVITRHVWDNSGIRRSQHGFMKGRSYYTNPIFYDWVTCLVEEGKDVDIYLDIYLIIFLLEKLTVHGLDRCALCWVKNFAGWRTMTRERWWMKLNLAGHRWYSPGVSTGACPV